MNGNGVGDYEELANDEMDLADEVRRSTPDAQWDASLFRAWESEANYHVARAQVYATLATGKGT